MTDTIGALNSPAATTSTPPRWIQSRSPRVWIAIGVTVALFVLTWISALRRPFVDDDWSYLNVVQQGGWWHSPVVWNPQNGLYRPILYIWFGVLHSVFGLHPLAYHIATLVVVLLVGVLTWRVAVTAGLSRGAAVAGAIVLMHASVAYPIAWTSAASSPIAVAFGLGAIVVVLNHPLTTRRAVASAFLLAFGLLTREVVVVAPVVVIIIAWARPGGAFSDAARRSLPLWIADIGYVILRAAFGAGNPPGPYHQEISAHALTNFFNLIIPASGLSGVSPEVRSLAITGFILFMAGIVVWGAARRQYVLLRILIGGLIWFILGTLPVIFLVHHSMENYYVDFALPGLALAIGAACEIAAQGMSDRTAIVVGLMLLAGVALVGHTVSNRDLKHDFAADSSETQRLLVQVRTDYPNPSRVQLMIVRSSQVQHDQRAVTSGGDLFRVTYHDPNLRVRLEPLTD